MDAVRFERMCNEVLERADITSETKVEIIRLYCAEYRAYTNRLHS